jgi:hypothetical protein
VLTTPAAGTRYRCPACLHRPTDQAPYGRTMAAAHQLAQVRLTPAGARVVGIGVALLLAWVDLLISPGLGLVFAVTATLLCFWVSARARREALFTAAVLPPLAFLAGAVLAGLLGRGVGAAAGVGTFVDSLQTLAATAPGLYVATAAGAGLAVLRRILAGPRRREQTRGSPAASRRAARPQPVTSGRREPPPDQRSHPGAASGRPAPGHGEPADVDDPPSADDLTYGDNLTDGEDSPFGEDLPNRADPTYARDPDDTRTVEKGRVGGQEDAAAWAARRSRRSS